MSPWWYLLLLLVIPAWWAIDRAHQRWAIRSSYREVMARRVLYPTPRPPPLSDQPRHNPMEAMG